jgi:hypothetical protein
MAISQKLDATEEQIRGWPRKWPGTGILTATTAALDADIGDEAVARTVENFVRGYFGSGKIIVRYGRRPRFLIPFRCEKPFGTIERRLAPDNKFQFLGDGKQFVCDGVHPVTRRPYAWEGGALWTVGREELPLISEEAAISFLDALITTIERSHPGFITETQEHRHRTKSPLLAPELAELLDRYAGCGFSSDPEDMLPPATVAEIKAALSVVPSTITRSQWVGILSGIFKELGDGPGFEIANAWVATVDWAAVGGKIYRGRGQFMTQWRPIVANDGYSYTIGTLFHIANEADPDWRERIPEFETVAEEPQVEAAPKAEAPKPGSADFMTMLRENRERAEQAKAEQERRAIDRLPASHYHGETSAELNRRWLIKNLLTETGFGLISGQWGTAKTFVVLDIAGCVMPGVNQERFIDYRIKRRGGVLFVAAEGCGSIRLRFETMLARKLGRQDQDNPHQPFAWVNFQPELLRRGAKDLIAIAQRDAKWMREKHGVDLVLIIIDTVAAAAAFQKEDDAAQAQKVLNALGELSAATGALVLGVDHFGKDVETGTRGSSAKEGGVENVLSLLGKREVTGKMTDLRMGVRKVKDAESGRVIPFRLETINCGTDEDGDPVTTCVVHWEPERPPPQGGRPVKVASEFLDALACTAAEDITLPDTGEVCQCR